MKNGVLSNFTRFNISSDRVRSGYEIRVTLAFCVFRFGLHERSGHLRARVTLTA